MGNELLSVSGKKIAYVREEFFEDRPYLVFLHDSLSCIQLWKDFPMELAQKTRCNIFIYDRLGYGQSDDFIEAKRDLDYMEKEADLLVEILGKCDIKKAILFGHGDGGSIALITAGKYQSLLLGIITEGAHIFVEDITLGGIRAAKTAYQTTQLPEKLAKYHGSKTQALFDAWTETWLRPDFLYWNIACFLPQITCPTLVIQGFEDEFGSEKQVQGILEGIRHERKSAQLIPNAQHTPHKEAREWTLNYCSRFILSSCIDSLH